MRIWGKFYPSGSTGISEDLQELLTLSRLCIYPNPFKELTEIRWQIGEEVDYRGKSIINIKILDITGRLVNQWNYPATRSSGYIVWDGTYSTGRSVSEGVYFCRFSTGNYSAMKKLILMR